MGKKKLIPSLYLLIALLLSVSFYFSSSRIPRQTIIEIIEKSGIFGIGLFILLNLITYSIAPLSNSPLLVAGHFLYKETIIFYIFVAMVLSFFVNFWIARIYGQKILKKLLDIHSLNQVNNLVKNRNLVKYFLLMRLFQGAGQDVISYAAGLSSLPFGKYLAISTLGCLPQMAIWYLLTLRVKDSLAFLAVSQLLGIGLFFILSLLLLPLVFTGKKKKSI